MTKEIDLTEIEDYIKALHCDIRWVLIDILKKGPKSSNEIFNAQTRLVVTLYIQAFISSLRVECIDNPINE